MQPVKSVNAHGQFEKEIVSMSGMGACACRSQLATSRLQVSVIAQR